MFKNLYTTRNIASVAFHYGATVALAAGSVLLGPAWAAIAAAGLVGGISLLSIKSQKKLLENYLVRHPDVHEFSPRLGEIVQDLYKKSGLKAEEYPVYDFRIDPEKLEKADTAIARKLTEVFNKQAEMHNAAALHLGKPVIMVSEPLLKLLDDREEKAVLAHEFAHVSARHSHVGMPQRILSGMAGMTNGLTILTAMVATGWAGILSAFGTAILSNAVFKKLHGKRDLLAADKDNLTLRERAEQKKLERAKTTTNAVVMTAVLTYFNPVYLGIYAAARTLSLACKVVSGTFSRSMEYQADRGAVALGADPLALVSSLRKMNVIQERAREHAFKGNPPPPAGGLTRAWRRMTSSHPTLDNRVKRLSSLARKNGVGEDVIEQAAKGPVHVAAEHNIPLHVIEAMVRM